MVAIGLSALSFTYRCGLLGNGTERAVPQPIELTDLLLLAERNGLTSLEFPSELLVDRSPANLALWVQRFNRAGVRPFVDSSVADFDRLRDELALAAALGAPVIRVMVSPVLEGARALYARRWDEQIAEVIAILRALRPLAEELNVCLGVENHQDADSSDLVAICAAVGGPNVGVVFDPVNALTVAEDPLDALARLGSLVRNVHLSDYVAYNSPSGFRLVRCAMGEGNFPLRRFFEQLEQISPHIPCQIELVAHNARHIKLLEDQWWEGYEPRDVRTLLPVLRGVATGLRPADDEWRTPWERGADAAAIIAYEDAQFRASINHLRAMGALPRQVSEHA